MGNFRLAETRAEGRRSGEAALKLGLGGDKATIAGGLKGGGSITLWPSKYALQRRDCGIEAGEWLLDRGDDPRGRIPSPVSSNGLKMGSSSAIP